MTKHRTKLGLPHFWDRPWTKAQDKRLGTRSDRQVAHELGRSVPAGPQASPPTWRPAVDLHPAPLDLRGRIAGRQSLRLRCGQSLGPVLRFHHRQAHHTQVASRIRGSTGSGRTRRSPVGQETRCGGRTAAGTDLGICSGAKETAPRSEGVNDVLAARPWTKREEKLLGTKPDEEVARLIGREPSAVRTHRYRKGIPPCQLLRRPFTKAEERLLGTDTDKIIARRLGRDEGTVAAHRRELGILPKVRDWTPDEDKLLGTMPDRKLAQHMGRTLLSVQNRRLKLGIPPAANPGYRPWTEAELDLIGTAAGQRRGPAHRSALRGCPRQAESTPHPLPEPALRLVDPGRTGRCWPNFPQRKWPGGPTAP